MLSIFFYTASIFTTIGHFVLTTSFTQTHTGMSLFGDFLALSLFIVAVGILLGGLYMTMTGKCPMKKFIESKMS